MFLVSLSASGHSEGMCDSYHCKMHQAGDVTKETRNVIKQHATLHRKNWTQQSFQEATDQMLKDALLACNH